MTLQIYILKYYAGYFTDHVGVAGKIGMLFGKLCSSAFWLHLYPEDGGGKTLRNVGVLPRHYNVSKLHPEDGGRKTLRNVGVLPRHYNVSKLHPEDGGRKTLRNVGVLPQHYTASVYVLDKWVGRCKKCITCQGRYFKKGDRHRTSIKLRLGVIR
jgi:hypothetical protein